MSYFKVKPFEEGEKVSIDEILQDKESFFKRIYLSLKAAAFRVNKNGEEHTIGFSIKDPLNYNVGHPTLKKQLWEGGSGYYLHSAAPISGQKVNRNTFASAKEMFILKNTKKGDGQRTVRNGYLTVEYKVVPNRVKGRDPMVYLALRFDIPENEAELTPEYAVNVKPYDSKKGVLFFKAPMAKAGGIEIFKKEVKEKDD